MSRNALLLLTALVFPCLASCQGQLGYTVAEGAEVIKADLVIADTDWPWWRGPDGNGIAPGSASPPVTLDENNLAWKAPIPGRGHSAAMIVGDRVFLTTADEGAQTQSVLCLARKDGGLLWIKQLHEGGFDHNNNKNSFASSSVASDGRRVFVSFWNHGSVWTTALDLDGKQLWQLEVSRFKSHQGYGASPAIYGDNVIVATDNKGTGRGCLVALNRVTGEIAWSQDRPVMPNYVSPIILKVDGKDQLLMSGCEQVTSYDPNTGKLLWSTSATTTECVGTAVVADGLVFASGGYPKHETVGVRADGSGEVVWRNSVRIYVPSLLAYQGHVYTVSDDGVAYCWEAATGKEKWKGRLGGGFSASPILAAGHLYLANEKGQVFVVQSDPEKLVKVATSQVGDLIIATPSFSGRQVFIRSATEENGRQEFLYCFENKK
jgi:outer membrane protein assembly factor BamB